VRLPAQDSLKARRGLHEPLAPAPLVLLEQYSGELGQSIRPRIVERPEDAFAGLDRLRDDFGPQGEGFLEKRAGRFAVELCELSDVLVGNPEAGEHHRGGVASAGESASEEGSPSGTDSGPDRSRRGPLLESCAAMPLATRRLGERNGEVEVEAPLVFWTDSRRSIHTVPRPPETWRRVFF
jgi:hypothetical protein